MNRMMLSGRRRLAVMLAGLLAVCGMVAAAAPTEAAWTRSQFGTSGTVTAITVPAPTFNSCVLSPGLLGADPRVTIVWTAPTGYTSANAQYGTGSSTLLTVVLGPLLSNITTTAGPGANQYTTVFGAGLLTGLLGAQIYVGIQMVHSSGWTSAWKQALAAMGALGVNPTCTIL